MSTEIEQIILPYTGEVIDLDGPIESLGQTLHQIREFEGAAREVKRIIQAEILKRMDKQAKWTVHSGGLKLKSGSPAPSEEFNAAALREALLSLVDEDELAIEAVDAAVEIVVDHKVHKSGINALRKLGGKPKTIVDEHAREVEKQRSVTIECFGRHIESGPRV